MTDLTTIFRIEMLGVALLFFIFVIRAINQNKLSLKRALSLFILAVFLLLFSVFPSWAEHLSTFFGFETTSNFLYFCAIIFLLVHSIWQSIALSNQEEKVKNLIQEVSIIKSKQERM
ncbi:DUF2304 family protein [Erwinia sp. CPCC 100877]|nr:DUF2304 family protein [Erwinia sp. CPCC 100877]